MKIIREKSIGEWISKLIVMLVGCAVMAIACAFFYVANMQPGIAGMDAVSVLMYGVERTFNISYGTAVLGVNLVFLLVSIIFMRKNIYFGTVVTVFLLGILIDFFIPFVLSLSLGLSDITRGISFSIIATVVYGIGIAMYLPINWGTTAFDGMVLTLGKYTSLPYKFTFTICCVVCAIIGLILGATIGYGTVIAGIFTGIIVDLLRGKFEKLYVKLNVLKAHDKA